LKRIGIIGAGDLGVQLAHHVAGAPDMTVAGFFDDSKPVGSLVVGHPVLGGIDQVPPRFAESAFDELLIAIGYKHMAFRQSVYDRFQATIPFARLVHARAWVDPTATIGPGAVLYAGCIVDMGSSIGANALLNVGCVVAHHTRIGAGSFLSPAVKVAGFVDIAASTSLGIGTIVIDNVSIASGVRTGAGAVVIHDLTEPGLYVGVPAKLKKPEAVR
jgi:sugar O-acyltransferase (sialic acid O-acetyltransferase NeuD family)